MSYDENYKEYLSAFGIPFFVIPIILGSKEIVNITFTGSKIKFVVTTDYKTDTIEFVIGEVLEHKPERFGTLHSKCTLPEPNHVHCTSEMRSKGLTLNSDLFFSQVRVLLKIIIFRQERSEMILVSLALARSFQTRRTYPSLVARANP